MNLHEECLLKYLSNPLGLSALTTLLKENNKIISENTYSYSGNILAKTSNLSYSTNKI